MANEVRCDVSGAVCCGVTMSGAAAVYYYNISCGRAAQLSAHGFTDRQKLYSAFHPIFQQI